MILDKSPGDSAPEWFFKEWQCGTSVKVYLKVRSYLEKDLPNPPVDAIVGVQIELAVRLRYTSEQAEQAV